MLTQVSVTTPASSRTLTQLATVKAELQIPTATTTDDAFLNTLISQSSAAIETFCGRIFAAQAYQETLRFDVFRPNIIVSQFPLVNVVSITEASVAMTEGNDWEAFYKEGIISRLISDRLAYWRTLDRIVLAYVAGYQLPGQSALTPPADALPTDIERACIELVKTEYLSRARNPNVLREDVPDVYSVSYVSKAVPGAAGGGALPPNIAGMLTAHRDLRAI